MQLFAPRALLAVAALLGASMVSGHTAADQSYAKPMIVRSGGLTTATLDVVFTDTSRRLTEERELAAPTNLLVIAEFYNNYGSVYPLTLHNDTKSSNHTKSGHNAKSDDDLSLRSTSLFPNLKPKVNAVVTTVGTGVDEKTVVTWTLPNADIPELKKMSFNLKLRVGPNVDSGDIMGVKFSSVPVGVIGDLAPIVFK